MADRTQDRIGAPGSLEELQRELAGALVPSSVEELQRQFAAVLEQQAATAQILEVINRSRGDLEPVYQAVLDAAQRLLLADSAVLYRVVDGELEVAALGQGMRLPGRNVTDRNAIDRATIAGQAALERRTIHVPDAAKEPHLPQHEPWARLGVPIVRTDELVGVITVAHQEAVPFTPRQISLLETFAGQVGIAIENARLLNETKEALEQQTATADVLKVISRSAFDLQAVLNTVVRSAAQLCRADHVFLFGLEGGDRVRQLASTPAPFADRYKDLMETGPILPGRGSASGRLKLERRTVHIHDVLADPEYKWSEAQELAGFRTVLVVPMFRQTELLGYMGLWRLTADPFSDREIQLVETFADQAVIAIENVRLFNETKEALEQQTALSEILRSISDSPSDVTPVFEAIARGAIRYCGAEDANVAIVRQDRYEFLAHEGPVPTGPLPIEFPISAGLPGARAIRERRVIHEEDLSSAPDRYGDVVRLNSDIHTVLRTVLAVPMLRGNVCVGAIVMRRLRVQPFTDRQIALARAFADQAAIAIENVRLFSETKEALEQQTAISEILRVISSSPTDVQPVLDAVAASARRFCQAEDAAVVLRRESDMLRVVAHNGPLAGGGTLDGSNVTDWPMDRTSVTGRSMVEGRLVHVHDLLAEPDEEYPTGKAQAREYGHRTTLAAPLLREGRALGALLLRRNSVQPFSDRQQDLVRTFADQAAIAIENVRLFNETKEALEQQTAMSEILRVISSSPTDVQPVLDAIAESAMRFCAAEHAIVNLTDGSVIRPVAGHFSVRDPFPLDRTTVTGRSMVDVRTQSIPDLADPRNAAEFPLGQAQAVRSGERAIVTTPMVHDGRAIGSIVLWRTEPLEFTDKQVQLVETFARQAVIAIENVRLFNEIQDKSRLLEVASRHKSEFLANMSHELRTPLNAIIGFTDVMLEEMFGPLNDKQKEYLEDVRNSGTHLLTLINDILDLSKIEAGRIELEIAEFSFPEALENALTLVRERATRHGITLAADVAGDVGRINADERKVKQVLVNLLANAVKFTPDGGRVTVKVRRLNGEIEVAVHDTGIGVAAEDQERIFDEFQQVGRDPERSREGTGLGLTLAKRFVELHGGRIWVESEVGKGSTFTFAIPVRQTALTGANA